MNAAVNTSDDCLGDYNLSRSTTYFVFRFQRNSIPNVINSNELVNNRRTHYATSLDVTLASR